MIGVVETCGCGRIDPSIAFSLPFLDCRRLEWYSQQLAAAAAAAVDRARLRLMLLFLWLIVKAIWTAVDVVTLAR